MRNTKTVGHAAIRITPMDPDAGGHRLGRLFTKLTQAVREMQEARGDEEGGESLAEVLVALRDSIDMIAVRVDELADELAALKADRGGVPGQRRLSDQVLRLPEHPGRDGADLPAVPVHPDGQGR